MFLMKFCSGEHGEQNFPGIHTDIKAGTCGTHVNLPDSKAGALIYPARRDVRDAGMPLLSGNNFPEEDLSTSAVLGIYSAFVHAKHNSVFIIASDMPYADARILDECAHFREHPAVVPRWKNGNIEPLCALYSRASAEYFFKGATSGDKRISKVLDSIENSQCPGGRGVKYLDIEELIEKGRLNENAFVNINSPEEYFPRGR